MRNLKEEEFQIKYDMYKDIIYNIAYTYVHNSDDSLDISQDVFMKYLNSNEEFETLDNEKYWLIRVTINTSKNYVTSSWKKKVYSDSDVINNYSDKNEDNDEKQMYYHIVTNLKDKYKEIIILHYYEDFKVEEIASILKLSISCVKKRLERGRQIIKEEVLKWKN